MDIPTTDSIEHIYTQDALATQTARWNKLLQRFQETFDKKPDFISRSPGRVNIIGEHIDYSLYEVIPMAIEADVLLAVSTHGKRSESSIIRLTNVHSEKFEASTFEIPVTGDVEIDSTVLQWTNYFKCGLRAATELLRRKDPNFKQSVGMDIVADGTVPSGGGLSSSAAFVCSSALAVLRANGVTKVDKKELVEIAIIAERNVGVNSGGMDQSASVFPLQGSALYVSFVPELGAKNISFPELKSPLTFIVAQSFVAADKHNTAQVGYNLRVVECTLAALVLAKIFGLKELKPDAGPLGYSLRGFHDAYFQQKENVENNLLTSKADFQTQLKDLLDKVDAYLPQEEGYTREQISEIIGIPIPEIEERFMKKFPVRADHFKLRQRAQHVFGEALRVLQFMEQLSSSPSEDEKDSKALLASLGDLLNDTQDSCRDLYECSCPELDELCELARSAGSYGSRITGAGWGGCSVHLVPQDKVEMVKQKWTYEYYKKRFPDITQEKLSEAMIVSKPGCGSAIFEVHDRSSL
ncbi:hypothetical protein AMS68_000085 [Peltaster fructicola]|uniref:Galactokinase n=1 Tax=Peltaster fructicola TaxID=286661 RepID=A0A6H0XIU5_9PEZI|nr:hypothetical protein AMS68_000085 [Peltaster fructicola]